MFPESQLYNNFFIDFHVKSTEWCLFFSIWVVFYEHSRFTGQKGKGKGIYLKLLSTTFTRFTGISRTITAESSSLHIASDRTRTGDLWFLSASR